MSQRTTESRRVPSDIPEGPYTIIYEFLSGRCKVADEKRYGASSANSLGTRMIAANDARERPCALNLQLWRVVAGQEPYQDGRKARLDREIDGWVFIYRPCQQQIGES